MDDNALPAAAGTIAGPACAFARALLARQADCGLAERHALGEREAIGCRSPVARTNCATLLGMLRERAAFTLKQGHGDAPLAHALALRLQCGGLAGLAQAAGAEAGHDVHALVAAVHARYGDFAELPWPAVVAAVAAWQGRARHGGRG